LFRKQYKRFQSTPPHGGRQGRQAVEDKIAAVSIHAPARGATTSCGKIRSNSGFQSTPPHGGRREPPAGIQHNAPFQSTPPHGGRPAIRPGACCAGYVSIHAPARGATAVGQHQAHMVDVSIHAPARGATTMSTPGPSLDGRFNPRPRTGGDLLFQSRRVGVGHVSIHAPARGATRDQPRVVRQKVVSIHAPARGATRPASRGSGCFAGFQSTPPHGGRPVL